MKTTMLFAAILIMFFVGKTAIAEDADSVQTCQIPMAVKKALSLQMYFPQEARELNIEGVVTTCFFITPEGKLKVYCINDHPLLTDYVIKKLESFECCRPNASIANKHMLVRFNFDIQNL